MLLSTYATAQEKFVPSVVALYPTEIKADSISQKELLVFVNDHEVTDEFRKTYLREGLAPNWKKIREFELAFMERQDFYTTLLLSLTRELTYLEIEYRTNLLIYPLREPLKADLVSYKKMTDKQNVSWLLNLANVTTEVVGETRKLSMKVQLYNVVTNRIYIDKVYTADSLPEDCTDDAWLCLFSGMIKTMVFEVSDKIEKNIRHVR